MTAGKKPTTTGEADAGAERRKDHADVREEHADEREREADGRERDSDVRERTLDRWEDLLAARAAAVGMYGEAELHRLAGQRDHREQDHAARRAEADERRTDSMEREIDRTERAGQIAETADDLPGTGGPPERIAALASELQTARQLDETAHRILAVAVEVIAGCQAATIVLHVNGHLSTAAATDEWAARADSAQLTVGSGPLIAALDDGMITTRDLTADDRWPDLRDSRDETPAHAALSYGMAIGDTDADTGAITYYSRRATPFDAAAERVGNMLAVHASVAIARILERLTFEARTEAWQHALASRDLIGQAKGILMQHHGIDADEAFRSLRDASQRHNRKVRDIAAHVVHHRTLPTD